jgi:hypothetical protein
MDVTFPKSLSRMRKPIIPPCCLYSVQVIPDYILAGSFAHVFLIPGIAKKQRGRVGKNNTGAVKEFYELIIEKAQRLEFTTHLACFVKHEKNYFAKLILPVI